MKVVQTKKVSAKSKEKQLHGFLYRKNILEHQIKVAEHGANISCAFVKAMEDEILSLENSFDANGSRDLKYYKLRYDLLEAKKNATDYISDFKEYKGQYEEGVKEDLKKFLEEEKAITEIEIPEIAKLADFKIDNSGTFDDLKAQIRRFITEKLQIKLEEKKR